MKSALKRIFTKPQLNEAAGNTDVKQEEAFYSKRSYHSTGTSKKLNPVNKQGQVSRCVVCDSKMHWASHCPHKQQPNQSAHLTEESCEEVELVLMTEQMDKQEIFVAEASKSAVIDTACTKTIAGEIWFENYIDSLALHHRNMIRILSSTTKFKF